MRNAVYIQRREKIKMDKKRDWIFTFGCGQEHAGHYVKIHGTYDEARAEMFRRYGDQ